VLLQIPSSRPNPQTFSQFVQVQILGFLAARFYDSFETYVRKNFSPHFSNIYHQNPVRMALTPFSLTHRYTTTTTKKCSLFAIGIDLCHLRPFDTKPHVCKHMFIILLSRIQNRVWIRGFLKKICPNLSAYKILRSVTTLSVYDYFYVR